MSKIQYSNYVTAIRMYRREYGYFPPFFEGREEVNIGIYPDLKEFIETLSGRTADDQPVDGQKLNGNLPFNSIVTM
ncbi:MAG: hypothetical protein ACSHYA_00010 [Opitutaceae bacterium]